MGWITGELGGMGKGVVFRCSREEWEGGGACMGGGGSGGGAP